MSKIVKILSDGTVAKVGMIVVVIKGISYGNKAGHIDKITHTIRNCNTNNPQDEHVKLSFYYERTKDLRKATPEERKLYYQQLNK